MQAVRLVGSVPRFHFVLLDGPTQLLVEWIGADAKADAKAPTTGRHDLATRAAQWGSRVFPATCDLDLNCSPPKDWLCEASGDHFVGWVDLHDGSSASLCLAVIRGSGHPSHELPCTTLLYTPGIPMM